MRKLNIAYFAHSVRSDWNNGNAHFLRGLLSSLVDLGHIITIYEPHDGWALENLRLESGGEAALNQFVAAYQSLKVISYESSDISSRKPWRERLEQADFVLIHEWNPPELAKTLLDLQQECDFRLVFHDTHHRVSSSPEQIARFQIDRFDGVLAFGESLRKLYQQKFGIDRVWTFHEAADTNIFKPDPRTQKTDDVIWVGNWGDEERSAEITHFLLRPAQEMPARRFAIYGVRYPDGALAALQVAGIRYCGYLPNLAAPAAYAAARLTVHIPRQQYVAAVTGVPTIRVFEALACGIPLLSAPWDDSESLFRRGDFLTVRNASEMRRGMELLLNDEGAANAQAQRGLETILTKHTCRHRAQQLITIFEESLS